MKFVIIAGATLALVTAAGAADIPRPQPVYQQAPVGKMPIGKTPWEDPDRQDALRDADLLIRGIDSGRVEFDLYRRKGEAWQIGRRDRDCACLRDSHSQSCSSAKSSPASAHEIDTRAGSERFISPTQEVASVPPTRMRLHPLNCNRRKSRPESQGRDRQRVHTTSISEPERRRAGDMLSSGSGRQASEQLKSRALPLRETRYLMYLVI